MLDPTDPLFWLIAVGMTLPWLIVIWQGQQLDKWQARAKAAWREMRDAQFALMTRAPEPRVSEDGAKVVPFEPRVIEGGKSGGKYQRPPTAAAVVDIPFKGPIS